MNAKFKIFRNGRLKTYFDVNCFGPQVLLDNIVGWDGLAFGARLGLLFQIVTVYPLVAYIVRVQIMLYFFGDIYPGCVYAAHTNNSFIYQNME